MINLFGKKTAAQGGAVEYIVVGLGNPGRQYENTRHNAGFIALDKLADKYNCNVSKMKYKALIGDCTIAGKRTLLMKPQTFMNLSGEAVVQAMSFYKIPPENVIVLFDDISLDVGRMRIRRKGSDGGQKGMRSIIELSGSSLFPRVKIGIGEKPNPNWQLADWVLSRFTAAEREALDKVTDNACGAVEYIIAGNIDKAMADFNS
ncbi:MAG: aminoacyl-tRNA hydrolase [Acutalibacteraceae bacterium]|nr:aminoacyl-tRNA hydrolase [Acutalibacteraceae bacterium]